MEFDIIGDRGDSVRSISKSNSFCRQVKSREYYTLLTFCCIFYFFVLVVCVIMGVFQVNFGGLFKFNDTFSVRSTFISVEVTLFV